ncbi:MAG: helix-turn-helix domain-containing protein [Bacteroidales bacterium]|nr:helix-turn-helix domain-containing protein [Bacteroidales bacterium]
MQPRVAYIVFFVLVASSVAAGIDSMLRTERRAQYDVDQALALTLRRCEPDRIDADTISVYRSLITMAEVRDTAYLSFAIAADDERRRPTLTARTGLTIGRLWSLSDQRASGLLSTVAALWLMFSLLWLRHKGTPLVPTLVASDAVRLGGLSYDDTSHRFYAGDHEVKFTPMQRRLMEQFMRAPEHRLRQQDICDELWPKKADASATLYTLIRRLKPVLEAETEVHIECNRGDSYQLTDVRASKF